MGKIVFVLGGARSGKSAFAEKIAAARGKKIAYLATCRPRDAEMKTRVAFHRASRPKEWKTFEAPENAAAAVRRIAPDFDTIIVDCLTLLVSNLFLKKFPEKKITAQIKALMRAAATKTTVLIVSNEIGMSVVPDNAMARAFRDIAGRMNQLTATASDEVYLLCAGIPVKIK